MRDLTQAHWSGQLTLSNWWVTVPIDPDLPIYKHNFVVGVAHNIREKADLDKWVSIAHVTHMTLEAYLDLDEFWQQAVFEAVNDFVKDQNKAQQGAIESMTEKIEQLRPYSSPMATMPKPNFALP